MVFGLSACAETDSLFKADPSQDQNVPKRKGPPPIISSLMDQQSETLLQKMGQPSLLREEIDAQVWQYDHSNCVLFFYLYRSDTGRFSVSHIEARAKDGSQTDPQSCAKNQFSG